ncbi:hypothetical protein PCASD_04277 [Puccinia coronata f. sp. avenae]|uniref:Retrotransposon gag domain-containing protein n=1 Tax=Puccinia coronata f. sp. avenae TaxID=200324 RepID=A0A2N5VEN3_9BASI|nr:hypothetical protein PCASD_04277 [Puccinia coronata f. sp. avenae]
MSLPNSPQPLISLTTSPQPHQNRPFLSTCKPLNSAQNSPRPSLPPLSPIPNFSSRPIDSLYTYGQPDLGDSSVNALLAQLSIDNRPIQELVMSNTERIAQLQTTGRRQQKEITKLKKLLELNSEVVTLKANLQQDLLQICQGIDAVNTSTNSCLETIEQFLINRVQEPVVKLREPPYYAHLCFLGDVRETNPFCFFICNAFKRLTEHFANEKHRILWITGYFRASKGKLGNQGMSSFNWWRGLLGKNAAAQGLDASKGSLAATFVIDELLSSEFFLQSIKRTFTNHKELEDARKALKTLKQGKETIEQFNIIFNSLLYLVDLSDASKCEIYADAIHPEIVNLGLQRGGWSGVTNLDIRQSMAVLLANDVAEVLALEPSRARGITAKVEQRFNSGQVNRPIAPIPKPVPPPKLSEGTPMDLDAIAANIGFTYALFKQECIAEGLCHKCAGPFDSVHEELSGCPCPEDKQLTLKNKLTLWKNWGGYVHKKKTSQKLTSPKEPLFKGKKRENMSVLEASPVSKRREGEVKMGGIPLASTSNMGSGPSNCQAIAAMEADPLSLGE